jgi:OmpA-OmpF porin, OOP family
VLKLITMKYLIFFIACALSIGITYSQTADPFTKVNSPFDEMNPVISPDGNTLFITIANHPQNIGGRRDPGDIWISTKTIEGWSTPSHGGRNLNNSAYNGVAGISQDGNVLYLLSHYKSDGSSPTTQGISVARKTGNGWSTPENIMIPYFVNRATTLTGFWHESQSVVVLAAEGYNSAGAEDVYVTIKRGDRWSELINLGTVINSAYQEMSPALNAEGTKLYYASNGRKGYGSFDIYVSERLDDTWTSWSEPVNLGKDINSEGRELYFRLFPSFGISLYTSTRNSDGYGDVKFLSDSVRATPPIVEVKSPVVEVIEPTEPVKINSVIIKGRITNAKSGEAVTAQIRFTSDSLFTADAAADGNYSIALSHSKSYSIEVNAPGFINLSEKLNVISSDMNVLELNFKLQPIEVGAVVNLKSVLFEIGTTTLLEESYSELNVVVDFLKTNPKVEIELEGHTDNRGDAKKNLELSQQRVDKIKSYLVSKGISARRVKGKGFGGSRPIATNDSEEARKLNRRVEFRIVKN